MKTVHTAAASIQQIAALKSAGLDVRHDGGIYRILTGKWAEVETLHRIVSLSLIHILSALYTIEISENQKTCIELALREFATAHPEIVKSDDFDLGSCLLYTSRCV